MNLARTGDWIATYSGTKFFITDPHPDDVKIEDIAHALSLICRYGGHCREFYSVAQHSLLVHEVVGKQFPGDHLLQLHALIHDATEAYLGDMVRPLKRSMDDYRRLEEHTEWVICQAFKIPTMTLAQRDIVKYADNVLLMTERRDLVNHCGHNWTNRAIPMEEIIEPMMPEDVENVFIAMFHFLWLKINPPSDAARGVYVGYNLPEE